MKNKLLITFILPVVIGCGSDDDSSTSSATATPIQSLNGSWIIEVNASCGYGFSVEDSNYVFQTTCVNGNQAYTEIELGSISATEKTITLTNEKNSCTDIAKSTDTVNYNLSADKKTLNMSLPGGLLSFYKYEGGDSGGNLIIEYGCYDENGDFFNTPDFTI